MCLRSKAASGFDKGQQISQLLPGLNTEETLLFRTQNVHREPRASHTKRLDINAVREQYC
jgi:hypothetical protein